jgi:hypothetical protein
MDKHYCLPHFSPYITDSDFVRIFRFVGHLARQRKVEQNIGRSVEVGFEQNIVQSVEVGVERNIGRGEQAVRERIGEYWTGKAWKLLSFNNCLSRR